jgi:hypothetical protein
VFYGTFPSGNGIPRSDFVAMLSGYHNKIFAPQTIIGTASAVTGGIGGRPVGFVHSGVFSPNVPRGASPVFGMTPDAARSRVAAAKVHASASARRVGNEVKAHANSRPRWPLQFAVLPL